MIQFLQAPEVGFLTNLTTGTVYKKASTGEIASAKIGNNRVFEHKAVREFNTKRVNASRFEFGNDMVTPFSNTAGFAFPDESN